jgi:hypothetical protein
MWAIVHNSSREPINNKPLTPEEVEIHRKINKSNGRLMLTVAIFVFSSLILAFIFA